MTINDSTTWTAKAVYPCDCYGPHAPYCTIERPMPNCNRKQRREAIVFVMDAPDTPVAKVATPEAAQRIVRAVNAHDALLAALVAARKGKVVNNWLTGGETVCLNCGQLAQADLHDDGCWVPVADAAIALATGTSDEGAGS